jgi:hypothetical protein
MLSESRRTQIQFRTLICKSSDHHKFRAAVRLQTSDDGSSIERSAEFRAGRSPWSPLPICPSCSSLAEEDSTYDPLSASVPESERFLAWLSPDGQRVAVPGKRGAMMPERYRASGYRAIEASSIRDFDRIERIREAQTGNETSSEMNFSAETRRWRMDKPYDPDSMTE